MQTQDIQSHASAHDFDMALKTLAEEARDALRIPFVAISFFPKSTGFFAGANVRDVKFIPSEQATCISTVVSRGVFSVTEMHFHAQFSSNPFVREAPFIRSYLGCAVLNRASHPIGTFCAFDTVNRDFSERDARMIQSYAGRAAAHVELLTLTRRLAALPPHAKLLTAIDVNAELGLQEAAEHMISVLYAEFDARAAAEG